MPVIAFSYENTLNLQPNMPDVILDGALLSLENQDQRQVLDEALKDPHSFLVSSSKKHTALDFAKTLNVHPDTIRAKKVDLNDLYRGLQMGNSNQDPAEAFYQRDVQSAADRLDFSTELSARLQNYNPALDQRLDDRRKAITSQAKQDLLNRGEALSARATTAKQRLSEMPDCHAAKVHHGFLRMQYVTPESVFNEHTTMINLNNEAQMGGKLFEIDYKQAQDVLNTLYTRVDEKASHIADKYLGMKDGKIDPHAKTEFSDLALNQFPDLLSFGMQTEAGQSFKQISSAERLSELFKTKMSDGTPLINPAWFNGLHQAGIRYDISDVHKNKSTAAKHLLGMQKPAGMQPKDALRFDFVVDMLKLRQDYITYDKNNTDIDKILTIAEDHDGKVPLSATYAGAISKRFTAGGEYSLNSLGMQKYSKSVLKAPKGGVVIDIDYSQAELAMAAAILNNQALLQAYNDRSDIYLALGLQADHVVKGQPMPWDALISETNRLQQNTPAEAKADENGAYHRMRSGGKMVVIPAIYGSGVDKLAKEQGITTQQAQTLMTAFNHVFPEVNQTREHLGHYLVNNVGQQNANIYQFGGHDGKLVTINPNDKEFCACYNQANPFEEISQGLPAAHQWIIKDLGFKKEDYSHNQDTVLSVTLSNGEKMIYQNPTIRQTSRGQEVYYQNKKGKMTTLAPHTLLQNITQFAAFSATREMTVNAVNEMQSQNIQTKYLLNIHDSTAFLAQDRQTADQTMALMQTGVLAKSKLVPALTMAYTIDIADRLAQVEDMVEYRPNDNNNDLLNPVKYEPVTNTDNTLMMQSLQAELDLTALLGEPTLTQTTSHTMQEPSYPQNTPI